MEISKSSIIIRYESNSRLLGSPTKELLIVILALSRLFATAYENRGLAWQLFLRMGVSTSFYESDCHQTLQPKTETGSYWVEE